MSTLDYITWYSRNRVKKALYTRWISFFVHSLANASSHSRSTPPMDSTGIFCIIICCAKRWYDQSLMLMAASAGWVSVEWKGGISGSGIIRGRVTGRFRLDRVDICKAARVRSKMRELLYRGGCSRRHVVMMTSGMNGVFDPSIIQLRIYIPWYTPFASCAIRLQLRFFLRPCGEEAVSCAFMNYMRPCGGIVPLAHFTSSNAIAALWRIASLW